MGIESFLDMGGYARYVWSAYAIFFIVLAIDWIVPGLRRRHLLRELRSRVARQKSRATRKARANGE